MSHRVAECRVRMTELAWTTVRRLTTTTASVRPAGEARIAMVRTSTVFSSVLHSALEDKHLSFFR